MPEQAAYPQIPTNVWWGVRSILNRNPRAKLDDTALAVQLDVQPAAARQYLAELKRLGLLTEEGNATELALRWRVDETYRDATNEMLSSAYPEELVALAPAGSADRGQVERWFMMKGLGQGTAKNKAATYVMLANAEPTAPAAPRQAGTKAANSRPSTRDDGGGKPNKQAVAKAAPTPPARHAGPEMMPLNVNVQIHISADASTDQIESIFASMRKHLYGDVAA